MFYKKYNLSIVQFERLLERAHESQHLMLERISRKEYVDKDAEPVKNFIGVVDRGHKNGCEVHALYSDGSIRIFNLNTCRFVTILFARPGQALRLADKRYTTKLPQYILDICMLNVNSGKNYC